jgi:DNA polymerase
MNEHPLDILEWLSEMGDDVPLLEEPIDRFAESAEAQKLARQPKSAPVRQNSKGSIEERVAALKQSNFKSAPAKPTAILPDETVLAAAREAAEKANSLEALKIAVEQFEGCNLRMNAKQAVFASGDPTSTLMIIDEHPGRDEDAMGIPFAGQSGILLEKMLASIGLTADKVYQAASIPWHPPGSRSLTLPELEICRPFLERHIELTKPKLVLCLGNTPSRLLFDAQAQVLSLRGSWKENKIGDHSFSMIASLAPSFLLQYPVQKKLAWQDLLSLKKRLAETG